MSGAVSISMAFALASYLCVAATFAAATHLEGWHRRDGWDIDRVLGLAACLVWPAMLTAIVVAARRGRSRR